MPAHATHAAATPGHAKRFLQVILHAAGNDTSSKRKRGSQHGPSLALRASVRCPISNRERYSRSLRAVIARSTQSMSMRVTITTSPGDQSTRLMNRIAAQADSGNHPGRFRATNSVCQSSQQAAIQGIALGKVSRQARTKKVRKTVRPIRESPATSRGPPGFSGCCAEIMDLTGPRSGSAVGGGERYGLTRIIHGQTLARSASEGLPTSYPRLRVGLVSNRLRPDAVPMNNPG
jgi:hypothetical protein